MCHGLSYRTLKWSPDGEYCMGHRKTREFVDEGISPNFILHSGVEAYETVP
jgi:hypothetical protein